MFLVHSLAVVGIAYWISVLVAESVIDSPEEMRLMPVIRTCFAFFFSILYFTAAWQLVSVGYAWLFGGVLLSLYSYGNHGPRFVMVIAARIRTRIREHLRWFGVFIATAMVFFVPLVIGNVYGPFSEGGGDLTIYGAISKLLTDKGHTEHGMPGDLSRFGSNLKEVYDRSHDAVSLKAIIAERVARADPASLNYPSAEGSANKMIIAQSMTSFAFTPYGMYAFLAGSTNYPVYFGIQAFLYCIIVAAAWAFGRRLGTPATAWLAAAMVAASHALVSIPYNSYAVHTLALALGIVMLNAVPVIRLNSAAGFRTSGVGFLYLWATYIHFLAVVVPVAVLGATTRRFNLFAKGTIEAPPVAVDSRARRIARAFASWTFALLIALLVWGAATKSLAFVFKLVENRLAPESLYGFFGAPIPQFGWKGLSFVFGLMSQQHYLPFVAEYSLLNMIVRIGVVVGIGAIVLGIVLLAMLNARGVARTESRSALWLYAALTVTIVAHLFVSQSSLYTQAKGAQNVLLCTYALMVLPLAVALRPAHGGAQQPVHITRLAQLLLGLLVLFCAALAGPRIVFAVKLGLGQDRASILGQSYFDEAAKIRSSDPAPYVLFEPRTSADLYLSDQAFFGADMIPTRHLTLERLDPVTKKRAVASVPEFIQPTDLSRLWLVYAEKKPKWVRSPSLNASDTTWKSLRLVDSKDPVVVLFGGDYFRSFGPRPLGSAPTPTGNYSHLRNGGAMLMLPAGPELRFVLRLEPRIDGDYDRMLASVMASVKKMREGSTDSVDMSADGKRITLSWRVDARDKPTLKTLVQYEGEYWLNVRRDDRDCDLVCR